jgi:hypothetical protein
MLFGAFQKRPNASLRRPPASQADITSRSFSRRSVTDPCRRPCGPAERATKQHGSCPWFVAESFELSVLELPTNPSEMFSQACFSMHCAADYILSFVPSSCFYLHALSYNISHAASFIGSGSTKYIRYSFVALCGLIPSFVYIFSSSETLQSLSITAISETRFLLPFQSIIRHLPRS